MAFGDVLYGETPMFRVKEGVLEELVLMGYGEKLIWSHEDGAYRLAKFIYGKSDASDAVFILVNEHDAFSHSPMLGKNVFFDRAEAEACLVSIGKMSEKEDINAFFDLRKKRRRRL